MKWTRINISVPIETAVDLKQKAKDRGLSLSEYCRNLLCGEEKRKESPATSSSANGNDDIMAELESMKSILAVLVENHAAMAGQSSGNNGDVVNLLNAIASNQNKLIISNDDDVEKMDKMHNDILKTKTDVLKLSLYVRQLVHHVWDADGDAVSRSAMDDVGREFNNRPIGTDVKVI